MRVRAFDQVSRAIFASGFGPLCEQNPPGGAPTGDPAPTGSGDPGQGGNGGQGGGGGAPADQVVPYSRFKEVNDELQARRKADQDREAEEARRKGDFETLSKREKEAREAAEQRAVRIARRAAFIARASGKVADPDAAFKLAAADGLLDQIDVDDEGNAKDPAAVDKVVENLTKTYAFLKADQKKGFGSDSRSGQDAAPPSELPKDATAMDYLRLGVAQAGPIKGRRG